MVMPLVNLSSTQQCSILCPHAQTIQIYPLSTIDSSSTTDVSSFISSSKIIQTLIISKYKNKYVQPTSLSDDETVSSRDLQSKYETISISFRGQIEHFRVVNVIPDIQDKTNRKDDKNEDLTTIFDQLDISGGTSTQPDSERALKSMQQYLKQRENGKCSDIAYKITSQTKIRIVSSLDEVHSTSGQSIENNNADNPTTQAKKQQVMCAGLDSTLVRVKDALLPPLLHPNLFPADGPLRPPKGALLYGPAGAGKSLLANQIANDLTFIPDMMNVHVRLVQCADILSSTAIVGEAEQILTGIFQEAENRDGGSLIILDDVHLICPRRGGMGGSGSLGVDQLAGTLLALLDGIGSSSQSNERKSSEGGLVVLAITTDPSLLDPALRRPGRLDVEVEVPVPDDNARAEILRFHISQLMTTQQVDEIDIIALAKIAKGFTGADCKLAVKEAVRNYLSRTQQMDGECDQQQQTDSLIPIEYTDLEHAIRITKPSAIKSVAVEVPKVPWSAIGGMDDVKALLKESIELPLTHPHLFEMMRVPPPKGILLYGPPGCSKTLMARAIATEGNMNFLAVKGPELLSKWLGESERALASLFRRARLASPSVIFFDEMDAIASKRGGGGGGGDRLLSQLLTELDGVTSGGNSSASDGRKGRVIVVGATNRPDVLDPGKSALVLFYLMNSCVQYEVFEI